MSRRFSLGSVRSSAARFCTVSLCLWGYLCAPLGPVIVYAVPARAAWDKSPRLFWRAATLLSCVAAAALGAWTTWVPRSVAPDGAELVGYPIRRGPDFWMTDFIPATANLALVAGLAMLPLNFAAALDTWRRRRGVQAAA